MAHTMITIGRGTSPILFLDSGTSSTNALTLSAGSVWIPAQQFVPAASGAANIFVALKVTGKHYSDLSCKLVLYTHLARRIYDLVSA
jgi:hypothetical protein